MNFCILGAGAWGTALAIHLARGGNAVTLVPRREAHAKALEAARENEDYLPGIAFPSALKITHDLEAALEAAQVCFLGCPTKGLRPLAENIATLWKPSWDKTFFITLCKGLEQGSLVRPTEVLKEVLPGGIPGVLNGPNFAREIAEGKPAATVLAAFAKEEALKPLQAAMSSESLRVYRSLDVEGVELGGALKNVYAIGAGVIDGLDLGDNAKASYLTRSLHELVRLGTQLGGDIRTFYGLSGFGDLVATCQGAWSRNRTFGDELGSGKKIPELLENRKTVVEGYYASECFWQLCQKMEIDAPIIAEVYAVLYGEKAPQAALKSLMTRSLKSEA